MTGQLSSRQTASGARLELSALQHAWLVETGLERRILGHYLPVPTASEPAARHQATTSTAAGAGQNPPQGTASRASDGVASGADLAMEALKLAGGRRRTTTPTSPADDPLDAARSARGPAIRPEDLPAGWAALQAHAEACRACNLQAQRDQLVFGEGETSTPEWLIVGEAPGKADDRTGLPFQGKSGKLLHAMLVAVGVHPASVVLGGRPQLVPAWSQPASMYFSNLVKCRPLGNRSPDDTEVAACMPYLKQQVELLQPRRILALGRIAAQALLGVTGEVEDLRGRVHHITTMSGARIPVVVTWHPAVLLMHPQNKGQAWADLNLAKQI